MLKTHSDLIAHKWAKVTCEIQWDKIYDAMIQVEDDRVFICQNKKEWLESKNKLGYKYSWSISSLSDKYEECNRDCTNIQLVWKAKNKEEPKKTKYKLWDIISTEWLVPFEYKTCKELGLKVWDLVVSMDGKYFDKWEIITLKKDDWSEVPSFTNWKNNYYIDIYNIAPLPTTNKKSTKAPLTVYETIIRRNDWLEFKKGMIGEETIEQITARQKSLLQEAAGITALLKKYNSLNF